MEEAGIHNLDIRLSRPATFISDKGSPTPAKCNVENIKVAVHPFEFLNQLEGDDFGEINAPPMSEMFTS